MMLATSTVAPWKELVWSGRAMNLPMPSLYQHSVERTYPSTPSHSSESYHIQ